MPRTHDAAVAGLAALGQIAEEAVADFLGIALQQTFGLEVAAVRRAHVASVQRAVADLHADADRIDLVAAEGDALVLRDECCRCRARAIGRRIRGLRVGRRERPPLRRRTEVRCRATRVVVALPTKSARDAEKWPVWVAGRAGRLGAAAGAIREVLSPRVVWTDRRRGQTSQLSGRAGGATGGRRGVGIRQGVLRGVVGDRRDRRTTGLRLVAVGHR